MEHLWVSIPNDGTAKYRAWRRAHVEETARHHADTIASDLAAGNGKHYFRKEHVCEEVLFRALELLRERGLKVQSRQLGWLEKWQAPHPKGERRRYYDSIIEITK